MFSYRSTHAQLIEARRENRRLRARLDKIDANLTYVAMMTDVEIEEAAEPETETETTEEGEADDEI